MTPLQLYPPIAAATVTMVIWVSVGHRLYKRDLDRGDESFQQLAWLSIVPIGILVYVWFFGVNRPVTEGWQVFAAAITGEGMAIIGVFGIHKSFFQRHEKKMESAYWFTATGFILFIFAAGSIWL